MRGVVLVLASTMAVAVLLASGVAQAIINGKPDRGPNAHSYAGAYVAKVEGKLLPVCSGTLISPRVFLTAGHCTEFLIKEDLPTYVSFDPTYKPAASEVIKATPYTHPRFCLPTPEDKGKCSLPPNRPEKVGTLPRDVRFDVGVAVLEEPVRMATYGTLRMRVSSTPSRRANVSPSWDTAPPDTKSTADRHRGRNWSIRTTATGQRSGFSTQARP